MRKGLTLIELLVVIAIIGALAALTLIVFFNARKKGYQGTCVFNLRQIWFAFSMYAQDHDNRLPPYRTVFFRNDPGCLAGLPPEPISIPGCSQCSDGTHKNTIYAPYLLLKVLDPYMRNKDIWFCPGDPYARTDTYFWCVHHKYLSYFLNIRDPNRLSMDGMVFGEKEIEITPASKYVLASDVGENPFLWRENAADNPDYAKLHPPGGLHFNGENNLYLDGHVKWIPYRPR